MSIQSLNSRIKSAYSSNRVLHLVDEDGVFWRGRKDYLVEWELFSAGKEQGVKVFKCFEDEEV